MALELGRRLVESGSLHAAEDIFFLETSEVEAGIVVDGDKGLVLLNPDDVFPTTSNLLARLFVKVDAVREKGHGAWR